MYIEVTGKRLVYRDGEIVIRKRGWIGHVPDSIAQRNSHLCRPVAEPAAESELDALQTMQEMANAETSVKLTTPVKVVTPPTVKAKAPTSKESAKPTKAHKGKGRK